MNIWETQIWTTPKTNTFFFYLEPPPLDLGCRLIFRIEGLAQGLCSHWGNVVWICMNWKTRSLCFCPQVSLGTCQAPPHSSIPLHLSSIWPSLISIQDNDAMMLWCFYPGLPLSPHYSPWFSSSSFAPILVLSMSHVFLKMYWQFGNFSLSVPSADNLEDLSLCRLISGFKAYLGHCRLHSFLSLLIAVSLLGNSSDHISTPGILSPLPSLFAFYYSSGDSSNFISEFFSSHLSTHFRIQLILRSPLIFFSAQTLIMSPRLLDTFSFRCLLAFLFTRLKL